MKEAFGFVSCLLLLCILWGTFYSPRYKPPHYDLTNNSYLILMTILLFMTVYKFLTL